MILCNSILLGHGSLTMPIGWESDIRAMVKDASDILARAPTPPDGFYDSDVAGTPWVATPEHLAASVAGMQNWVRDEDTEDD